MTNYSIEVRMSENEKLDDQLRNGTDYVNLPQHLFPTDRAPTWIPQQESISINSESPKEIRYRPATTISQIRSHHYTNQQQIDAQNRLQQLELIRPKENLDLLNVKFRHVQYPRHSRPILPQYRDDYVNTLYDQTGSFVHERAGLYHTETYEPSALTQALPELTNQNDDSSSLTTEKTSSKLFQTRALGDYQTMRNQLLKKLTTPNDSGTIDIRTQEGNKQLVQTQTIYGQSFNTPKFLQDNRLAFHARTDPTRLMSTRFNANLNRVRSMNSFPLESTENLFPITNSNQPLVSPVLRPSEADEIYSTNAISEHTNGYIRRPTVRVYDSPFQKSVNLNRSHSLKQQSNSFDSNLTIPKQIPRSIKTVISLPGQEIVAKLIEPTFAPRTTYQQAFKDVIYQELPVQTQKPIEKTQQQSMNNRLRQSQLRDIQERWSKTQALKEYHLEYPEAIPDIGGDTIRAKKEILLADEFAKRAALIIR